MIQKMITAFLILIAIILFYFILRRVWGTFRSLTKKRYPNFVYTNVKTDELGIPVFVYHSIANFNTPDSVKPAEFERHMRYLAENNYQTLSADELHDHLVYGKPVPSRSVVITFDDGRATLWTVAFPILKKYNLKVVSFIVTGSMPEKGLRPTIAEIGKSSNVSSEDLINIDLSIHPIITWDEVKEMYNSGLVDFQSHSLHHALVYTASDIVDFINPEFRFEYNNYGVPLVRYEGVDRLDRKSPLGTPLYRSQPLMSATRRFFDDEGLRNACVNYVEQNEGKAFFARTNWRSSMFHFVKEYRQKHELQEMFETVEQQVETIRKSLIQSKEMIEEHLPGHKVRHLCFPWNRYSITAACLARESGYVSAFIDINPQKPFPDWNDPYIIQRDLPINQPGDDSFQITRIDSRDNMVLSLPGKGRLTYFKRFASRLTRLPGFLEKNFQRSIF